MSSHDIVMVGDDGKVYRIKSGDLGKIAEQVPRDQLSPAVRNHIDGKVGSGYGGGGAVAHILVAKSDILTAGETDILATTGAADILASASSDILVSGDD